MDLSYWKKQTARKPLFPDIEWGKPERKDQAGKLGIIGGNKLSFAAVAGSYQTALETGAGQAKVLLPDALKKQVPATLLDVIFAPTNPSGSLSVDSKDELSALSNWANAVLLVGDAGRNSETAIAYEQFLQEYSGQLTITRDVIDLIKNNSKLMIERPDTMIVASFSQVQKLFQGVYYPKMLTFNMQLLQIVEALHKFTITYPCTIVTMHKDSIVIAHAGQVVTQDWTDAMAIWGGNVATRAACYWLWSPQKPLESATASIA